MRLRTGLLCIILLSLTILAHAADIPKPTGYVTDSAGILQRQTIVRLEKLLADFERSDSTELAILTVNSLDGEPLEDYALQVAEAWGVGQQGKDNGALLLVARQERKVRIEVGYGLEGRLTDLLAGRIIDQEIVPYFKKGDYDTGVYAGVTAMLSAVRGEYQGTGQTGGKKRRNPFGALILLLFLGPGLLRLFSGRGSHHRNTRRGGFYVGGFGGGFGGGGGGGGGFGGFGGGGFGGGGASGGW
jgi:uncharacterized protein